MSPLTEESSEPVAFDARVLMTGDRESCLLQYWGTNLEDVILNKISQVQEDKHYMMSNMSLKQLNSWSQNTEWTALGTRVKHGEMETLITTVQLHKKISSGL